MKKFIITFIKYVVAIVVGTVALSAMFIVGFLGLGYAPAQAFLLAFEGDWPRVFTFGLLGAVSWVLMFIFFNKES